MVFTSLAFLVFFLFAWAVYWSLKSSRKAQNVFLLLASYFFYCAAAIPRTNIPKLIIGGRFSEAWHEMTTAVASHQSEVIKLLLLLWLSSTFAYLMAKVIEKTEKQNIRKWLMVLSAVVHLGILCYFKYMNFFAQSFVDIANTAGWQIAFRPEHIILPLAISFFTFHILGYTFDVYQKSYAAATNYIDFITHVAFFPQLVAGPIERAGHLLPQFTNSRSFSAERMEDGIRQILWGFFKKLVIADSAAKYVNYVFMQYEDQSGSSIVMAGIMFTIQMYCDFSGYSDIALGTAKLLGFDLLRNFNFPFFSTSMTDFWRKWHISLTSWITDYLYTPISFQKRDWGLWGIVYAAIISFTLSGLWHGANWPSVLWGLLHGLALGYEVLTKKKRKKWAKQFNPVLYSVLSGFLVFMFWTFGQLVFRATSLEHLGGLLAQMASSSLFTLPSLDHTAQAALGWALLMFGIEWFQREKEYGLSIGNLNYMLRWTIYAALIMLIFSSDNLNNQNEFIYFQF